jgi:hypothetical protein
MQLQFSAPLRQSVLITSSMLNKACLSFLLTGTCITSVLVSASSLENVSSAIERRFENPPAASRMLKIVHGWPDEAAAQDRLIASLKAQGFGGVVCNVSFADYLQDEGRWNSFTRAVRQARDAGLAMWLYDEKGYPSATAGGQVLRNHPEWEASGLLITEAASSGNAVSLALPPGELVLAAAFPSIKSEVDLQALTNLTSHVRDRVLSWTPAAGEWKILAITSNRLFEGTHAAMSLSAHLPYPNLLLTEPTARFLELTHSEYARRLGTNLGEYFVATFTDEPSLMSLFLKPMPYKVLPWSSSLPTEFRNRRGYDLPPLLPSLVVNSGTAAARTRFDYWLTVGELVSENFFGQIQEWCARHNLYSGGHLLMEENLVNQVPLYGNFMQCLRRLDAPSIDCLTSIPDQVPWIIAKMASGAAALEQRQLVMCETSDHGQRYRPPGDTRPVRTASPAEIRGTCNRLIVSGVNVITSYFSFADLTDQDLRQLNDWIGRACASLTGGFQVADIAVLVPIQSIWPRFIPARHLANAAPEASQIESIFHDVTTTLFHHGRDFTAVDAQALADARVEAGALLHGPLRWRVVVLPSADTLPIKAWDNLARFVESGGVLISIGVLPRNSEIEFPSARVVALARKLFEGAGQELAIKSFPKGGQAIFLPAGQTPLLPGMLNRSLENDFQTRPTRTSLRHTHRQIQGQEVFFVINDGSDLFRGQAAFACKGPGRHWNLATGQAEAIPDPAAVELTMGPYDAALFTFPAASEREVRPLSSDNLARVRTTSLRLSQPLVSHGEFVQGQLNPLASGEQTQNGWRVTGKLTRSAVDTFLFLRFPVMNLDLSTADFLSLRTAVPENQHTPAELLLVLQEKSGADYIAHSGRWLGAPGDAKTSIPLHRFQLAGWAKDPNHRLDLSEIAEIRIGWGGYLGTVGETVEFTLETLETSILEE